jgi:hypothetical protein
MGKRAMLPENTGIAGSAALAISGTYRSTFGKIQMVLILVADKLAMVTASQNEEAFVYWRHLLNVSGKYFVYQTRPGDLESPGSCCELAPRSL